MPNLEQIYSGLPEQGQNQAYRAPSGQILTRYHGSIQTAYEQAGLDITITGRCPGFDNDEGEFQIATRGALNGRTEITRFLAASPDREKVVEGAVAAVDGKFASSAFLSSRDGGRKRTKPFELSKRSWGVLTDFVMEHAANGIFVPVKQEVILPVRGLLDKRSGIGGY